MGFLMQLGLIILLFTSVLIAYLFKPLNYEVNDRFLSIKRPLKSVFIELDSIEDIRIYPKGGVTVRTFASGGFFGYFGKFHNDNIGDMTYYATSSNNKILIVLKSGENIVVTPDDEKMLEILKSSIQKQ